MMTSHQAGGNYDNSAFQQGEDVRSENSKGSAGQDDTLSVSVTDHEHDVSVTVTDHEHDVSVTVTVVDRVHALIVTSPGYVFI